MSPPEDDAPPTVGERPDAIPEAELARTEDGLVPQGDGWFVLNARDARWYHAEGRSAWCDFEGDQDWDQIGVNIQVLEPGQAMGMYHWEADQEDFLLVRGEALLVVEGEERPLRRWDFVHCPPGTNHIIVATGTEPAIVVAVGGRAHQDGPGWGGYTVDEAALRHGAGVEQETTEGSEAYASVNRRNATAYRPGWLPD